MHRSIGGVVGRILPQLAAIGCIVACIQLGFWQQQRAEYKQTRLSQWEQAPTLIQPSAERMRQAPAFSQVQLTGRFDPSRHILLDNQTRNNHPGVHVFVPFQLSSEPSIVLVNRGWQPYYRHTNEWPDYSTPSEEITLTGRLSPPPRVGLQLGQAEPLDPSEWPNLMTYFDLGRIQTVLGPEVFDQVLLLDPNHSSHLSQDPWPGVNMGPDRHTAYAFQWFAIAAVILLIWLGLSYRFYWKKNE